MDATNIDPAKQQELINGLVSQAQQIESEVSTIEVGEEPATADKKSSSASKTIINISFIVIFVVGVVGSFLTKNTTVTFDMDAYVKFISVFAYIWAPLVVAVGGGRAIKNYTEKKYNAEVAAATGMVGGTAMGTGARAIRRR